MIWLHEMCVLVRVCIHLNQTFLSKMCVLNEIDFKNKFIYSKVHEDSKSILHIFQIHLTIQRWSEIVFKNSIFKSECQIITWIIEFIIFIFSSLFQCSSSTKKYYHFKKITRTSLRFCFQTNDGCDSLWLTNK